MVLSHCPDQTEPGGVIIRSLNEPKFKSMQQKFIYPLRMSNKLNYIHKLYRVGLH